MKRIDSVPRLVRAVAALGVAAAVLAPAAAGAAPAGNPAGIGTKAALQSPDCDAEAGTNGEGKTKISGWYWAPPCVKPWRSGSNNGGATAPGVTAETIAVTALVPNSQQKLAAPPTNLATGAVASTPDDYKQSFLDAAEVFTHSYELWGREVEFTFVESSGDDEASQRADALSVLETKPFMVINAVPRLPIFESEIAAAKTVMWGLEGTNEQVAAQAPYRYSEASDLTVHGIGLAELVGKQFVGSPVAFAGDESLNGKKRVFGLVVPSEAQGVDLDQIESTLARYKGKLAIVAEYTPPVDASQVSAAAQQDAGPIVAKLKDAGVTTVLTLASQQIVGALTRQATAQQFSPEWVNGGYNYTDLDLITATFDKDQWAHAVSLSWVSPAYPLPDGATNPPAFSDYWGRQGIYYVVSSSLVGDAMTGLTVAGPKLNAKTLRAGYERMGPVGGSAEKSIVTPQKGLEKKANGYEGNLFSGHDFAISWYSPTTEGLGAVFHTPITGKYVFVNDAQRYQVGGLPTEKLPFFDSAEAFNYFTSTPDDPALRTYPCTDCPSASASTGP